MAIRNEAAGTTCQHALQARLLDSVTTTQQDAEGQIELSQWHCRSDDTRKIRVKQTSMPAVIHCQTTCVPRRPANDYILLQSILRSSHTTNGCPLGGTNLSNPSTTNDYCDNGRRNPKFSINQPIHTRAIHWIRNATGQTPANLARRRTRQQSGPRGKETIAEGFADVMQENAVNGVFDHVRDCDKVDRCSGGTATHHLKIRSNRLRVLGSTSIVIISCNSKNVTKCENYVDVQRQQKKESTGASVITWTTVVSKTKYLFIANDLIKIITVP